MSSEKTVNVNLNYSGLLGIVFIVLKLTGFIAWSWWWVLAPFWFPVVAIVLFVLGIALLAAK